MSKVKESEAKEKRNILGDIIFYFALFCVLAGLLFSQQSNSGPKVIGGYAVFHVLTSSMEPEIPKEALVVTQEVSAHNLTIGDDITYMVGPSTSITHRIVGITENYQGTGSRGFETQGINNSKKDKEVVMEDNIVGKVIYSNQILGKAAVFLTNNWYVVIIYIFSFSIIKKILMMYMSRRDEEDDEANEVENGDINQEEHTYQNEMYDPNVMHQQPIMYDQWGNPIYNNNQWNQGGYDNQWANQVDTYTQYHTGYIATPDQQNTNGHIQWNDTQYFGQTPGLDGEETWGTDDTSEWNSPQS